MISPSTRVAGLVEVSRVAMTQMTELLGASAEAVSELEVVELERIAPSTTTTTIVGTYEVEADEHGNVLSFRCFRRYREEKP